MSASAPRLNHLVTTPAGNYYDCEIHDYTGLLKCPRCQGWSVGSRVKVTKCLYPCEAGGVQAHGSLRYAHVGEIRAIDYLQRLGHNVERDVIGFAVDCPWSNVYGGPDEKIIWALEVASLSDEEYDAVYGTHPR